MYSPQGARFQATCPCFASDASRERLRNRLRSSFRCWPLLQDAEAAAAAAPPLVGSMHIEDIGQLPPDDGDGPGDDATIDEIQDYFLKRQQVHVGN